MIVSDLVSSTLSSSATGHDDVNRQYVQQQCHICAVRQRLPVLQQLHIPLCRLDWPVLQSTLPPTSRAVLQHFTDWAASFGVVAANASQTTESTSLVEQCPIWVLQQHQGTSLSQQRSAMTLLDVAVHIHKLFESKTLKLKRDINPNKAEDVQDENMQQVSKST